MRPDPRRAAAQRDLLDAFMTGAISEQEYAARVRQGVLREAGSSPDLSLDADGYRDVTPDEIRRLRAQRAMPSAAVDPGSGDLPPERIHPDPSANRILRNTLDGIKSRSGAKLTFDLAGIGAGLTAPVALAAAIPSNYGQGESFYEDWVDTGLETLGASAVGGATLPALAHALAYIQRRRGR
jgi:hypothetical protein